MKKFLTVGTDRLVNEFFSPIKNSDNKNRIKPTGGLWATQHLSDNYNEWVDFLINHFYIVIHKNGRKSPFNQPCCLINLSDNANVFELNSVESLNYLINNFPHEYSLFDYEELSKHYDGIYISLRDLINSKEITPDITKKLRTFNVDTLLLFNPKPIINYQSGEIKIEPFDYEWDYGNEFVLYDIIFSEEIKDIENLSFDVNIIINQIYENIANYLKDKNMQYNTLERTEIHKIISETMRNYSLEWDSQNLIRILEKRLY